MNISIKRNQLTRTASLTTLLRLAAITGVVGVGLAFAGGATSSDSTAARPARSVTVSASEQPLVPARTLVYYMLDTQTTRAQVEMAESVTAQERALVGIVVPERVVVIIDDTVAGRMTAAEAMLLAH